MRRIRVFVSFTIRIFLFFLHAGLEIKQTKIKIPTYWSHLTATHNSQICMSIILFFAVFLTIKIQNSKFGGSEQLPHNKYCYKTEIKSGFYLFDSGGLFRISCTIHDIKKPCITMKSILRRNFLRFYFLLSHFLLESIVFTIL